MRNAYNGFIVVSEICQLTNIGTASATPPSLAYVTSTGQWFQMVDMGDTPPDVSTEAVSTWGGPTQPGCESYQSNVGTSPYRWQLVPGMGSLQASIATNAIDQWYIDPDAGSDLNDGTTTLTALKTFAELARRWSLITTPMVGNVYVTVVDTTTAAQVVAGDQCVLKRPGAAGFNVYVVGLSISSSDVYNGTSFTVADPSTNTPNVFVSTSAVDFSQHIGQFIRLLEGPYTGYEAAIGGSAGANTARTTPFTDIEGNEAPTTPVGAYQIVSKFALWNNDGGAAVSAPLVDLGTSSGVIFRDVSIATSSLALSQGIMSVSVSAFAHVRLTTSSTLPISDLGGPATFYGCSIAGTVDARIEANFGQCLIDNARLKSTAEIHLRGCAIGHASTRIANAVPTGRLNIETLDVTGASTDPIVVLDGQTAAVEEVYGVTAATHVVSLGACSNALYTDKTHLYATSTGDAVDFQNSVTKTFAQLPFVSNAAPDDSQATFTQARIGSI